MKGWSHPGPPQHEASGGGKGWKYEAGATFLVAVGRSITRGRPRSTLWSVGIYLTSDWTIGKISFDFAFSSFPKNVWGPAQGDTLT